MKIVLAGLVHRLRGVCRKLLYGHIAFGTLYELSLTMFSHGVRACLYRVSPFPFSWRPFFATPFFENFALFS